MYILLCVPIGGFTRRVEGQMYVVY